jgi:hypothetical protein
MDFMQIVTRKGYNGWTAKSERSMGAVAASGVMQRAGERFLRFTTSKDERTGGLSTLASVHIKESYELEGIGYVSELHAMFADYAKTVHRTGRVARITEKAVTEAHSEALAQFEERLAEAMAFYAEKEAVAC